MNNGHDEQPHTREEQRARRKKTTWVQAILIFILAALFLVGMYLIFAPQLNTMMASWRTSEIAKNAQQQGTGKKSKPTKSDYDNVDVQMVTPTDLTQKLLTAKPNQADLLGAIKIPNVNMTLAVYNRPGTSGNNLFFGAAVAKYGATLGSGNFVLAGHTMTEGDGQFFAPLFNVKMGDNIYVTDQNFVYFYTVTAINKYVNPYGQQAQKLLAKTADPVLTLYTCSKGGATRLMITAKQTAIDKYTDTAVFSGINP